MKEKAFTLVEIIIVIACISIVSITAYMLMQASSRNTMRGVERLETTMTARKIMKQVYADLKVACFQLPYNSVYNFSDVMLISGSVPFNSYSFLSFPSHVPIEKVFSNQTTGVNYRIPALISYILRAPEDANGPPMKLFRQETFAGKTTEKMLCDRVNFFEIKPIKIQPYGRNQFYYMINLQIIDSNMRNSFTKTSSDIFSDKSKIIISDFFEMVYPEVFNAAWNQPGSNPNWHTQIGDPLTR